MELQYASTNFFHKNGGNNDCGKGTFNTGGKHGQSQNNFRSPNPRCRVGNNKPICQIYGKQGHIAFNYWHHLDKIFQPSILPTPNNYNKTLLTTFMATLETILDPSWYANNSATNHVTTKEDKRSL